MPAPLYLVRHGQSEWNVQRLTQGQTSHPPLTAPGREQAARAAALIAADGAGRVPVVLASDLVRAVETAQVIAAVLGGRVVTDVRLREQHLGALEGRPYEETWRVAESHDWSDPELPVAGGESPAALERRMAEAVRTVDRSAPVVLVSHGDALRAVLGRTDDHGRPAWVEVPNGAVFRVADSGAVTQLDAPAGPGLHLRV